jgi:hypothetical protein
MGRDDHALTRPPTADDRLWLNERRRFASCEAALRRLEAAPELAESARAVIDLRERESICHPYYVARWRELLSLSAEAIRRVVLADTDEGSMLRQANPFAGFLNAEERQRILRETA